MAICSRFASPRLQSRATTFQILSTQFIRHASSAPFAGDAYTTIPANAPAPSASPVGRLSTATLLRRLFMCTFFTSPLLFAPGLAVMKVIANSKSRILNPDQNKLLRKVVKPVVYDQFCAGTNRPEIQHTIADIKGLGFSGVALCYGKEAYADQVDCNKDLKYDPELVQWREGTLETLDMVGAGDWLGMKMSGAGQRAMKAMMQNESPTPDFVEAMEAICAKAKKQGCRIWMDAEQQAVQPSIDRWTIDLMRQWNTDDQPLIYNTTQAYLKHAREKLQGHLELANKEGWTLGVKLVRGAYIVQDRDKIHDTKEQTDTCYETIAQDLIRGTFAGFTRGTFPRFQLLLCGHNPGTIAKMTGLAQELCKKGELNVKPEFAQLQGMADDVGCSLLSSADKIRQSQADSTTLINNDIYYPRVYKCLTWGSIQECMQYLVRRAVENRGAVDRIKDDSALFWGELRRRIGNTFRFS